MRVLLLGLIVVGCAHAACPTSAPPAPPVVIIVEPPPPAPTATHPLLCDVGCAGTMNRVPPPHACDDCPPGYARQPFRP